jgi:hypothetical protein
MFERSYGPRTGFHGPDAFEYAERDSDPGWCDEHDIPYLGDCPVCASEEDCCDGDDGGRDIEPPKTTPK